VKYYLSRLDALICESIYAVELSNKVTLVVRKLVLEIQYHFQIKSWLMIYKWFINGMAKHWW